MEIVAKTSLKRKGQAFVVFDTVEAATNAIGEIQGFDLFGKPMILDFAKTKSDAIVKKAGNEEEYEAHKQARLAEKGMRWRMTRHRWRDFELTSF